jgi:hypothetical protein
VNNQTGASTIAAQALVQSQGGVALSIASTTYTTSPPDTEFMVELLKNAKGGAARWGEALMTTQRWAHTKAAGQTGWYDDLARTVCIFGDPALRVTVPPPPPPPDNGGGTTPPPDNGGGTEPPVDDGVTPAPSQDMIVSRMVGTVNFARTGRDVVYITSELKGLPRNLSTKGMTASVNAGGQAIQATLDAHGKSSTRTASFSAALTPKTGVWTLRVKARGTFAQAWLDEGMKPAVGVVPIVMTVDVGIDIQTYRKNVNLKYTSKGTKTGSFRK